MLPLFYLFILLYSGIHRIFKNNIYNSSSAALVFLKVSARQTASSGPWGAEPIFMRRKRRPYILACISGIHGRILVIFSILQIPYAYSLCFILLTFVHGHCGKNYSDFNVVKWSEILATNCALTTNQIEKALIHHVSLYVYFWYIKFLANPCTLRVRDFGF